MGEPRLPRGSRGSCLPDRDGDQVAEPVGGGV